MIGLLHPNKQYHLSAITTRLVSVPVGSSADPVVVRQLINRTDGSKRMVLIVDELIGGLSDVVRADGVNASEQLSIGHSAAVGQHLATDVLGDVGQTVQVHQQVGLQLSLRAVHLLVGDVVAQAHQVVQRAVHQVVQLVVRSHQVQAKQASVLVAGVESRVAVGKIVLGDLSSKTRTNVAARSAGTVPRAQQRLHQHERDGVLGGPRGTLEGNGNVSLLSYSNQKQD